jgi:Myb-like DNA-binding domain
MNSIEKEDLKVFINQSLHIEENLWLVPCKINYELDEYLPVLKPNPFPNELQSKCKWTQQEDKTLLKLVSEQGIKAWKFISKRMNTTFHHGLKVKTSKKCRERWFNHVNPLLSKSKWTESEDATLIEKQNLLGNQWCEISKFLPGRNENSVKNRWNSLYRSKKFKEISGKIDFNIDSKVESKDKETNTSEAPKVDINIISIRNKLRKIELVETLDRNF